MCIRDRNMTLQKNNLCVLITHSKTGFTEIKSVLDTLFSNINVEYTLKIKKNSSFIEGRCGEVIVNKKAVGIIGEVHPELLVNFNLENPVAVFEINADAL